MKFGNLKIGLRLSLGFGIVIVITAVVGTFALLEIQDLGELTENMYNHSLIVSNAVRDIKANINAMHRSMKDVALSDNTNQINEAAAIVDKYEQTVFRDFEIVFDRFLGDMKDVEHAHRSFIEWKIIRDEVITLSKQNKKDAAADITRGKGAQHVDIMTGKIQNMIDFATARANSSYEDVLWHKKHILIMMAALLTTMITLGLSIALFITKSIVKPLNFIVERINDISEGDLHYPVTIDTKDEIGQLADSYRKLQSDLQYKASVAQKIAGGNFSIDIPPRSERDELGKSFYGMTTSLRKATTELKESEERYRQLVETMNDGLGVVNTKRLLTYVNNRFCEMLGYSKNELIGSPISNLFDNVNLKLYEQQTAERHKGKYKPYEIAFTMKDGQYVHTLVSPKPVFDTDGNFKGSFAVITDISERIKTEEVLKENEIRFRELFDNMSSSVAIYEAVDNGDDFIFRDFNKTGERTEKIKKKDLLGRKVSEVFPGVREFGLFEVFQKVWRTGKPANHPVSLYKDERIMSWKENYVYKLPSGELVAIYNDVTEQKKAEDALKISEEKYQDLYDNAPDMFVSVDAETAKILQCNNTLAQVTGYTKDEIIEHTVFDLYHPDCLEEVKKTFKVFTETGEVHNRELQLMKKDGSKIDVILNASALRDKDGKILSSRSVWRDISDLKKAEIALQESEKKYRTYIESAPNGVFILNSKGEFLELNETICKYSGYTEKEILSMNAKDLFSPEDFDSGIQHFIKLLKEGKSSGEVLIRQKDGTDCYYFVDGVKLSEDRFILFVTDLSELKEAEKAIRESEHKYRQLFENMSSGFALHEIVTDTEGEPIDYIFLDANNAFEKLTGLKKKNIIDQKGRDVFSEMEPEVIEKYGKVALKGIPVQFERYASELNKYFQNTAYSPEKGKFAVIFDEITERKLAENELRDFVYTVSHDLKAPLRKLDGFARLLESEYRGKLDDEALHYLDRIMNNTGQMKHLIEDLLELSRIGRMDTEFQNIDLHKVAEKVIEEMQELIDKKNAVVKLSGKLPQVNFNRTRAHQIFSNLISNALKFSKEETPPSIKIGYKRKQRKNCIFVEDNGIGIEPEYHDKIFGIFQRLHKKEDFEGTGIGLTIVKRIMDNTGGKIWVESKPGRGSTFYFTIPDK